MKERDVVEYGIHLQNGIKALCILKEICFQNEKFHLVFYQFNLQPKHFCR